MQVETIISMIEGLKEKQKSLIKIHTKETNLIGRETISRRIKVIDNVCDRLAFNFNMLPDSAEFLDNTIAEADLFLRD